MSRIDAAAIRGALNPAGFDFTAWQFANGIDAAGFLAAAPLPATDALKASIRSTIFDSGASSGGRVIS